MMKTCTKNDIKAMKETFLTTPYKGKPYMDYLRDKNKNKYIKYLKIQINYLNTNKPTNDTLSDYYVHIFSTMWNQFREFFDDPVADGSILDDAHYFWLPTKLMTGKDVYEQTKNVLNGLNMFKKDINKARKESLIDKGREKWIQNQKKTYFSFNINKLIKMSKKASNLYYLYSVKLNQDGTFANIHRATYKDVLYRLQNVVKKYTDKKYMQLVDNVNKIDNELIKIHTDCMIALAGHLEIETAYEHYNACDTNSFKKFKHDENILSHLPKCKESQIFKNNILNIFKITEQIIKDDKCTKAMSDKQNELYLPLYNIQNILRKKNFERVI